MGGSGERKEVNRTASVTSSATLNFVNRVEEMKRIRNAMKDVKDGKGQLLIIRGEAGSGKTRLIQETATEAEKQGFLVGFRTALAESVVPYHPWKDVLEGLGVASILDEHPPPKLFGLYLITCDRQIQIKAERKGINREIISDLTRRLTEAACDSRNRKGIVEGGFIIQSQDDYKLLLRLGSTIHLGAIVEGHENEAFLADMMAMADNIESMFDDENALYKEKDLQQAANAQMQQLVESEIYEGIDYSREDPKLRQSKLFEHVLLGLQRKARNRSLCIIIDDLQWADPSSLALLHYVTRNTRKTGIFFLGTYRIEEAESRPHLRRTLKGMHNEELLVELDLRGLAREYLAELAKSFIGPHGLSDSFLDTLWKETRGFPLFVREVLLGLEDDEKIVARGAVKRLMCPLDEVALPKRVRDVIQTRVNQLPREDRQLLDAASTCGTRFTAALVSRVAGEEEDKVLNGLRAIAKVHGLLRPADSGFTFDHPAVQEVLYDGVPIETRQTYHKEAAEWLELAGGPIEDIGEHYYRARDPRAVKKLQEAAAVAAAKYANDEASRLLEEALELALPEERGKLFELRADALFASTEYDVSIESYENALNLAESKYKAAEIRGKIGRVYELKGDYEETTTQCTQMLNLIQSEECQEKAYALFLLGNVHHTLGDFEKGLDYFTTSLEISEKLGDLLCISNTLNNIGNIYADRGDYRSALDYYEKKLAISKEIGDLRGIAQAVNNIGCVKRDQGNFESALEFFNKSNDIYEQIGDRWFIAHALANCGETYYRRGDYQRAFDYSMRALELSEKISNKFLIAASLINIGNLHYAQEDWDKALDVFRRSQELWEQIGYTWNLASVLNNIGTIHRELGEYEKAIEFYNKSLSLSEEMGERKLTAELYSNIAEVHLAKNDLQEALKFCERALSLSTEMGQKPHIGVSRRVLGMIFRERKMWYEATENFEDSIRVCKEIGERFDEALSHYEFGWMWKHKGDIVKANEHKTKAVELFEALRLPKRAAEARKMFDAETQLKEENQEENSHPG